MNTPFHLGKIEPDVGSMYHKSKIRRTYGWDCPYQDYKSNRHYNTQRHIDLTHGSGSGEPVDHMTGETRQEKRRATNESRNQSMNMPKYRTTGSPPVRFQENYHDKILSTFNPDPIRMHYLEAQERRVKDLGYKIPAQSSHNIGSHPSVPAGWPKAPPCRKNFPSDTIGNQANPYLSNINQLYNPLYSVDPRLNPIIGPLVYNIKILLDLERFRRCFR